MPRPRQPLTAATANPNAATAAAAVFKRHESNNSLSAAAAAAALRARPTTPIRVADVQTKRTLRRSASVASTASQQTRDQSGLRRRGSNGSMTERTFRTPSPHRPGSSGSGSARPRSQSFDDQMPPVPALPKNIDMAPRQPDGNSQQEYRHRKANSLAAVGPAPIRLASQKLATGEAPSWFGAAKMGDLGSVHRTDPAMASPPSSPLQVLAREEDPSEGVRPGSQASSINFSYPARARPGSTTGFPPVDLREGSQLPASANQAQPLAQDRQPAQAPRIKNHPRAQAAAPPAKIQSTPNSSDQALVYDPNSRRMVRQADLLPIQHTQQAVVAASQQRTGSKRKKRTPQRAGSHLAAGTMGRAKTDVSIAPQPPKAQPSNISTQVQPERLVQPGSPREAAPAQGTRMDVEEPAFRAAVSSPRIEASKIEHQRAQNAIEAPRISTSALSPASAASAAAQTALRRQPSVVREEREPEDVESEQKTQRTVSDALDAVPGRRRVHTEASPETHPSTSLPPKTTQQSSNLWGSPESGPVEQRPSTGLVNVSEDGRPKPGATEPGRATHVSSLRTHSLSPARQAHFGPVQDNLTVKHSPPPRSISPRKSAMKQASPPRGASPPSGDTSEASGSVVYEPLIARKKSVRVSFDDGGNGAAAEPAPAIRNGSPLNISPPHTNRHSWLANLGRGQDSTLLDDDVVMKPRPALPSFGSVRDRKPRDSSPVQSERPLVRPKGETKYTSPLLPSPQLGPSNDHAVGAVLSNDHARRSGNVQAASTHREPLPPVVTSVEGTGYISDSSDASSMLSSEFAQSEVSLPATIPEPHHEVNAVTQTVSPKPPVNGTTASSGEPFPPQDAEDYATPLEQPIPAISIVQPTPLEAEKKLVGQYFMDVPGGFPEEESDQSATSTANSSAPVPVANPAEVTPQENQSAQPGAQIIQPTVADTSSDSESDVFSDAYEDLSEIEGDGFQSLAAVVDSPLQQSSRSAATRPEPVLGEASTHRSGDEVPKLQPEMSSATTAVETPPAESPYDEWEKAKAYWRSLTAEKRAQLEREAIEEAGVEADGEEVQPETKPKKKKSIERRNSERKALAAYMAEQTRVQQEKERAANPDRSYMIQPGERWTGEDLDVHPMRKTMRNGPQQQAASAPTGGARLRKSMRTNGPEPPVAGDRAASKRPTSYPPVAFTPPRTAQRTAATQAEPVSVSPMIIPPTLQRRGSTGSESSFKRSRSAKGQGFGFRHSMRPTSPPSTADDSHSKRFSLRTLSPTGSTSRHVAESPRTSMSANTMRTTLRDSSTGRKPSGGGIRMPSFGLPYGGGKKSGSKKKASGSRASSRFADSSDEEGDGAVSSGFRSRFEDSSDDERVMPIPIPLPPNKPASTTSGSGHHLRKESSIASTALPEELEESDEFQGRAADATPTQQQPQPTTTTTLNTTLRRTRSGRGQLPDPSSTTQATGPETANERHRATRRGSFLSVLRHRKKGSGADKASNNNKIGRPEVTESAARRDTRLERSAGQLERIRSRGEGEEGEEEEREGEEENEVTPVATVVVRSPRLQKRGSQRGSGVVSPALAGAAGGENGVLLMAGGRAGEGEDGGFAVSPPPHQQQHRRSSASGNLGTRTLSGGIFHLHPHHRRVSSMGVDAPVTGHPHSVEGSVAGSLAGASSTTRKKRFGALRKIFGLDG